MRESIEKTEEESFYKVTVYMKDAAETVLTSYKSKSVLLSAQTVCSFLLKHAKNTPWFIPNGITVKMIHPIAHADMRPHLPIVKPGLNMLIRLLRHCCIALFGLELQIIEEELDSAHKLTVYAHGKYGQKLTLIHQSVGGGKKLAMEKLLAQQFALHFPSIIDALDTDVRTRMFPPSVMAITQKTKDIPTKEKPATHAAVTKTSFSLPQTDCKCTLQIMRLSFEKTFNYKPRECVRAQNHNDRYIWVEIQDENSTVIEHHRGRSLPFSLMECYGNILQRTPAAMKIFETMERNHPYSPPRDLQLSDGEGVFDLLVYVVRYELGLETICTVEAAGQLEDGSSNVRAILTAVSRDKLDAINVGVELFLANGWNTEESIARRHAAILALKIHFPIYYRKHEPNITNARPIQRRQFSHQKN